MSLLTNTAGGRIIINKKTQEKNPILVCIRSFGHEYSTEITCDFEPGKECGVLFLTMKYHRVNPEYIESRYGHLSAYKVKILLFLSNLPDGDKNLHDVNSICQRRGWTLIVCYSFQEAAEYLENLTKAAQHNEQSIMKQYHEYKKARVASKKKPGQQGEGENPDKERYKVAINFLTSIRSINTSDAKKLLTTFGSIRTISNTSEEDLCGVPGLGSIKAKNIAHFFSQPFLKQYGKIK